MRAPWPGRATGEAARAAGGALLIRLPRLLVALPLILAALLLSLVLARATAGAAWIDLVERTGREAAEWDCTPRIAASVRRIHRWAPEGVRSRLPDRGYGPGGCE